MQLASCMLRHHQSIPTAWVQAVLQASAGSTPLVTAPASQQPHSSCSALSQLLQPATLHQHSTTCFQHLPVRLLSAAAPVLTHWHHINAHKRIKPAPSLQCLSNRPLFQSTILGLSCSAGLGSTGWEPGCVRHVHVSRHTGAQGGSQGSLAELNEHQEMIDETAFWDSLDESQDLQQLMSHHARATTTAGQLFQDGHKQLFGRPARPNAFKLLRLDRTYAQRSKSDDVPDDGTTREPVTPEIQHVKTLLYRLHKLADLLGKHAALHLFTRHPNILFRSHASVRDKLVYMARQLGAPLPQPPSCPPSTTTATTTTASTTASNTAITAEHTRPANPGLQQVNDGWQHVMDLLKVNTRLFTHAPRDYMRHLIDLASLLHLHPQIAIRMASRCPTILTAPLSKHEHLFNTLAHWLAERQMPGPSTYEPARNKGTIPKRSFYNTGPLPVKYAALMTWGCVGKGFRPRPGMKHLAQTVPAGPHPGVDAAAAQLATLPVHLLHLLMWPGITLDTSDATLDASWTWQTHPSVTNTKGWHTIRSQAFRNRLQQLSMTVQEVLPAVSVITHNTQGTGQGWGREGGHPASEQPSGGTPAAMSKVQGVSSRPREDALGNEGVCDADVWSRAAAFSRACVVAEPRLVVCSIYHLKAHLSMLDELMRFNPQWAAQLSSSSPAQLARLLMLPMPQCHRFMQQLQPDDPSIVDSYLYTLLTMRSVE